MDAEAVARFRKLMKLRGFETMKSLSDAAGLGATAVRDILERKGNPRLSTVIQIANALDMTVSDFVAWVIEGTAAVDDKAPRRPEPRTDRDDAAAGARLASLRRALGSSVDDFSRAIGVTTEKLDNYEAGHTRIDPSHAIRIAQITGISIDWLYAGRLGGVPIGIAAKLSEESTGTG